MKNWNNPEIVILGIEETAAHVSFGGYCDVQGNSQGNGNTPGGPDKGGTGNGKKQNYQWTEAQKDGNTTFAASPIDDYVPGGDGAGLLS